MNKYALFVACTPNFVKHLNALLNSIEKRELYKGCNLTVYVLHYQVVNINYLEAIKTAFSFRVIPVEIKREDVPGGESAGVVEFVKRSRFFYILKYGFDYDVICLLDCDMFIVSPDFMKLFDLVKGTDNLIGCNEGFKWSSGEYTLNGEPIITPPTKLYAMHCSVPIILNLKCWEDVFKYYTNLCFKGKQGVRGIGDIYSWNVSVYACKKQRDVIVFPMETMCQVHQTYLHPKTFICVENDYWLTNSGDKVYSIQGRWNTNINFVEGSYKYVLKKNNGHIWSKIKKGLQKIQKEWYNLNYECILKLGDYEPIKPEWDKFKGE